MYQNIICNIVHIFLECEVFIENISKEIKYHYFNILYTFIFNLTDL